MLLEKKWKLNENIIEKLNHLIFFLCILALNTEISFPLSLHPLAFKAVSTLSNFKIFTSIIKIYVS